MSEVRSGRLERLAVLFERHHLHLYNFFLRMTGNRVASEDLTQEVFLRMLRYRASYRPSAAFTPWMWGIARNALRDHRSAQRPDQLVEPVAERLADGREGADSLVMRGQELERLAQALRRLDPAKRELLLLSRHPDLAYRDLAGLMSCSVASVKVQVHRALKELKAAFVDLQGGLS